MCSSDPLRDKVTHPELFSDPDLIPLETEAALFHTLPTIRVLAPRAALNAIPGLQGMRCRKILGHSGGESNEIRHPRVKVVRRRRGESRLLMWVFALPLWDMKVSSFRMYPRFKKNTHTHTKNRQLLWLPSQKRLVPQIFCAAILFALLSPYIQPIFYFLTGVLFDL